MKKKLLFVLCALLTVSCSDDEKGNEDVLTINPNSILGEWVTESHESKGNHEIHILEELKFNKSMTMYYSTIYDEAEGNSGKFLMETDIPGDYQITDNNKLRMNSTVGNAKYSRILNSIYEIVGIDSLTFKANIQSLGDTIEYHRIVGECSIKNESFMPDYKSMLPNATISKFWTYNDCIAEVDSKGEITGKDSGTTYVFIQTNQGIAAVRVRVKSFLDKNYDELIGKNKDEAIQILGDNYHKEDNEITYYYDDEDPSWGLSTFFQRYSGNWFIKNIKFDAKGVVYAITMNARKNVFFSPEEMTEFLKDRYYYDEKNSEEDFLVFKNAPKREDATVSITWNVVRGNLTFVAKQNRMEINIGKETYTPNYKDLIENANVLSITSENDYIATVDPQTGIITGKDTGSTVIDIETDQGMAYIDVNVHLFLAEDYDSLINCPYNAFVPYFGKAPFPRNGKDLLFKFYMFPDPRENCGNWDTMFVTMTEDDIGTATAIELTARKNVWFTPEEMSQYLAEKYHSYNKESNDTINAYINDVDEEKATCKIFWDIRNMKLTFQIIEHKPLPIYDFGRYMGKTQQDAIAMIESEYETAPNTGNIQFMDLPIKNNGINYVRFFINNESGIVQSITVQLYKDVDQSAIEEELWNNYQRVDGEYVSSDGLILASYYSLMNQIRYTFR